MSPEKHLWLAVLRAQIVDAFGTERARTENSYFESLQRAEKARDWLLMGKDMPIVAGLCGIDGESVRERAEYWKLDGWQGVSMPAEIMSPDRNKFIK